MKRTTTFLALFVFLIGMASAQEIQSSKFKLFKSKNGLHYLMYGDQEPGKVRVAFKDDNGRILQNDIIRSVSGFRKGYDLSGLEPGAYKIQLTDRDGSWEQPFQIQDNLDLAVMKMVDGKYRLLVNTKKPDQVDVKIYDDSGNVIHKDIHAGSFSRIYDLSNVESEKFYFELETDGNYRSVASN